MDNECRYEEISLPEIHEMLKDILLYINRIAKDNNIMYYLHAGTALGAVRHNDIIPWDEDADIIVPINEYTRFVNLIRSDLESKYEVVYRTEKATVMQAKIVLAEDEEEGIICLDIFPLIGIPDSVKKQKKLIKRSADIRKFYKLKRIKYRASLTKSRRYIKHAISFFCSIIPDKIIYKIFDKCVLYKYDYTYTNYVTNPCGGYGMKNVLEKSIYGVPKMQLMLGEEFPIPEKTDEYLKHYYGNYMEFPPLEARQSLMKTIKRIKK